MTLEEAIKHAEEVAQEKRYEYQECLAVHDMEDAMDCGKCGEEHEQIAEWLKELSRARTLLKATHELLESAQPERKKGNMWLIHKWGDDAKCSNCGKHFDNVYDMETHDRFCRFCGAKMIGIKGIK